MAQPDHNGIAARLWRLPGQLVLALINATAILVIIAAILALVTMARIDHFAGNVVATMTEAVLSKVELPQKDALANLRNLTAEVRALRTTLAEIRAGENPRLQAEIARLREALTTVQASVDRLGNARSILTDEAIGRLARAATDTLVKLRGCSPDRPKMSPGSASSPHEHERTQDRLNLDPEFRFGSIQANHRPTRLAVVAKRGDLGDFRLHCQVKPGWRPKVFD
jgi:hypothetical protein